MLYRNLLRPLLFLNDAEQAHNLTCNTLIRLQKYDAFRQFLKDHFAAYDKSVEVKTSGIRFPSPVGLAAGFDKNAEMIPALSSLGFGFLETGSVTARPAPGNPAPRMFRLPADNALINRMGLNNEGASEIAKRFSTIERSIPVGVNIAKTPQGNKSTQDSIQDYVFSYKLFSNTADYITLNISCPNTSDGTTFEDPGLLVQLLDEIEKHRNPDVPLFIKFSADTGDENLIKLLEVCEARGINGYNAVNTTTSRNGLSTPTGDLNRIGKGGLSGKPLKNRSRECLKLIKENIGEEKTLISTGGVNSGEETRVRLEAGANLVQVYTALIYEGPSLPGNICRYLAENPVRKSSVQ